MITSPVSLRALSGLAVTAIAVWANPTSAGGIMLYEAGQESAGLANAGAAALATDPSVLMSNPAGISQLEGTQINASGQLIIGDIKFSRDASSDFTGGNGGNALDYLPGASFFISHQLDDRSSIGFGLYGNFGLAVKYDDDWAGRYFTQQAAIIGLSLEPVYSYKVDDKLSLGIGPRIMYGYYRTEAAVDNNVLGLGGARSDGQLEYQDTDIGLGLNLGALYHLNERMDIGLAYTSKVDLEFEDRPRFDNINNPLLNTALQTANINSLELSMQVPQTLLLSTRYQVDPQWTLLTSLGWQDWSQFGDIGVEVEAAAGSVSTGVDRQYQDTWHVSAGAQYQASPQLRWSMGVGYDSAMVEDADRTADNPAADTWRFAGGLNYKVDDSLDLHLAYTLVWLGDMELSQSKARSGDTLYGSYDSSALHILGGGAVWRL
ncbi:MAG: outer membrane protein transport protein [Halopseudomonas sp.]|uniref:OmpP1/FadL family transporter n=1 Tax=Halopseudomonas sp. TaxID=2901191 RepID=UPI00300231A0